MVVNVSEAVESFVDGTVARSHDAMSLAVEGYLSLAADIYEPDEILKKTFGEFYDVNLVQQESGEVSISELEDKLTEFCHSRGIDFVDSDSWKENWGTRWLLFVKELSGRDFFFHIEGSVRNNDGNEHVSTEIFFHGIGYTDAGEAL